MKGAPFFLAPRWDKAKYLAGARADGGATFSYAVSMPFSTKAGAKERAAAQHIKDAYTKPKTTEPENTKKDIPGRTYRQRAVDSPVSRSKTPRGQPG